VPDEPPKTSEAKRRDERLAAALRENLRRRKAQARARKGGSDEQNKEPDSAPDR
jgi:hypothetical protein